MVSRKYQMELIYIRIKQETTRYSNERIMPSNHCKIHKWGKTIFKIFHIYNPLVSDFLTNLCSRLFSNKFLPVVLLVVKIF